MTARGAGPVWLHRFDAAGDGPRVAVKDCIDVAGTVTTAGSRALLDVGPARRDAACVSAVRRGGGRIVGKTNLSELCWSAAGVNDVTGTVPNPLDARLLPGGSSSGSAAAVALGEADVALGTDTGGSVRVPAACCGVAGLKTTWGRVPLDGVFPLAPGLDTVGPLARDVAGLVTAMRLLEDGFAVPDVGARPRVGRLRLDTGAPVEVRVDEAVDTALAAAGFDVVDVDVAGWDEAWAAADRVLTAEAGPAQGYLLDRADLLGDATRRAIEASVAAAARPDEVARAREVVAELGARLALALGRGSVPGAGTGDDGPDALDGLDGLDGLDALALPTIAGAPPAIGEPRRVRLTRLTMLFNVLGWPALSLPVGSRGAGRVPPSVQLVGPPGADGRLLALGASVERAAGAGGAEAAELGPVERT